MPDDDASSDYDFAFARVAPAPGGKRIEDMTGANRLSRTPGYHNRVTVIGYPHASENPDDQAVSCTTTTSRLEGLRQLQFDCAGFFSGTSGSPWLLNYNSRTRSGTVIGVIGGEDAGGLTDRISYSPFFDAIQAIYQHAVYLKQVKAMGPEDHGEALRPPGSMAGRKTGIAGASGDSSSARSSPAAAACPPVMPASRSR